VNHAGRLATPRRKLTQKGLIRGAAVTIPSVVVVSALAYLPFRVVYVSTASLGRAVAWLAEGYRTAPALERALIFPSWAILRGVFLLGCALAHALHGAAHRSLER
jgi:hypothetical protein